MVINSFLSRLSRENQSRLPRHPMLHPMLRRILNPMSPFHSEHDQFTASRIFGEQEGPLCIVFESGF